LLSVVVIVVIVVIVFLGFLVFAEKDPKIIGVISLRKERGVAAPDRALTRQVGRFEIANRSGISLGWNDGIFLP